MGDSGSAESKGRSRSLNRTRGDEKSGSPHQDEAENTSYADATPLEGDA